MTKKRSVLVAGALSFIAPGLGFVYVGKLVYAIGFFALLLLLVAAGSWTGAIFHPLGVLIVWTSVIGVYAASIVLPAILAYRQRSAAEVNYPKWYVYVVFIAATSVISFSLSENRDLFFDYEPFRATSGSMMPTLLIGDFFFVDTAAYNREGSQGPSRGDVVAFRSPKNPAHSFVKRVVGIPGDRIAYHDKTLYINEKPVDLTPMGTYEGIGSGTIMTGASVFEEELAGIAYKILIQPGVPTPEGRTTVPDDQYFVLGDNRDNSRDSRFFGSIPKDHLIGKARVVWMNWDWGYGINYSRFGVAIQ